jgi:DNA repair photolyase
MDFDPIRGRGATRSPAGRFARSHVDRRAPDLDEWPEPAAGTTLSPERSRSIVSTNTSPDLDFRQSINPYRGCEHGCIYCYARPAHAYVDLSPGLDFETQILFKPDAPARLREFLARPGYRCQPIVLGANTDAYQPAESRLGLTRELLQILCEHRHPVAIVTKSALVERDLDLLSNLARDGLAKVMVSVTTLDDELKRVMEPRTASPSRRLKTITRLSDAGVPTGTLFAPVIPGLNDEELDRVLCAVAKAGASHADYVLLRLPHEVRALFEDWLYKQRPLRAGKILSLIRQHRGGRANDPCFGSRMRGTGPLADLLAQRFAAACRRYGLARSGSPLNTSAFRPPRTAGDRQLALL